jgi:hypothetical protein
VIRAVITPLNKGAVIETVGPAWKIGATVAG